MSSSVCRVGPGKQVGGKQAELEAVEGPAMATRYTYDMMLGKGTFYVPASTSHLLEAPSDCSLPIVHRSTTGPPGDQKAPEAAHDKTAVAPAAFQPPAVDPAGFRPPGVGSVAASGTADSRARSRSPRTGA